MMIQGAKGHSIKMFAKIRHFFELKMVNYGNIVLFLKSRSPRNYLLSSKSLYPFSP